MELTFGNFKKRNKFDRIFPVSWPEFATYSPDINEIKKQFAPYSNYRNIIVIGNGGSIASLIGLVGTLSSPKRNIVVVDTMEPSYLQEVRHKCNKESSIVIAISKSGVTVGVIESLLAFNDYRVVVITSIGEGTLSAMASAMKWQQIDHPAIGGRFTGRTAVAYGPAYLAGVDIDAVEEGAVRGVSNSKKPIGNSWRLAKYLYDRELKKDYDIFMPVYSKYLLGYNHLVTQLMHESVGKNGVGQTILAVGAPESQHHTNQRYFGGRKNMAAIFVTANHSEKDIKINVPAGIKELTLRNGSVGDLDDSSLCNSLLSEAQGTISDAKERGMSFAHLELPDLLPSTIGEYMVMWQFTAYFSALLRKVDPLTQPQVERSKEIALTLRTKK